MFVFIQEISRLIKQPKCLNMQGFFSHQAADILPPPSSLRHRRLFLGRAEQHFEEKLLGKNTRNPEFSLVIFHRTDSQVYDVYIYMCIYIMIVTLLGCPGIYR